MAAIVGGDAGWLPIAIVDGTAFHFRGLSPATYQVSAIRAETDARLLVLPPRSRPPSTSPATASSASDSGNI